MFTSDTYVVFTLFMVSAEEADLEAVDWLENNLQIAE